MHLTNQYIALRPELCHRHHLNPTQAVVYSALIDRLASSRRQGQRFYDATRAAYFVNYSQPEMAAALGISLSTAQRTYDQLVTRGLLVKRHRRNASDCLYLPEFDGWWYRGTFNLTWSDVSFCLPNQLTWNQGVKGTFKTLDTVAGASAPVVRQPTASQSPVQPAPTTKLTSQPVTPRSAGRLPAPATAVNAKRHRSRETPVTRSGASADSFPENGRTVDQSGMALSPDQPDLETRLAFENLQRSLTTQGGIPAEAVALMAALARQDPRHLHELGRIVYQAKAAVSHLAERACGPRGYQALRWEHNDLMAADFRTAVVRIVPAAYRRNRQHWQGFAYVAFRRFFEEVANEWLQATHAEPAVVH